MEPSNSVSSYDLRYFFFRRSVSLRVRILWTVLSALVTSGSWYSLFQPYWFLNRSTGEGLGLVGLCTRRHGSRVIATWKRRDDALWCRPYGALPSLPSNYWQAACVLYGAGCVLFAASTVAVIVLVVCRPTRPPVGRVARYIGCLQAMSAVLIVAGLVVLPLGLESRFVGLYCPKARAYNAGLFCCVGWPYTLAATAAALSVFSPFLAQNVNFDENLVPPRPTSPSWF